VAPRKKRVKKVLTLAEPFVAHLFIGEVVVDGETEAAGVVVVVVVVVVAGEKFA